MKNIRHIFFDLDHTLWDFEKNSSEALKEIYFELDFHKQINDLPLFIETYQKINAKYWALYNHGKVKKEILRTIRFEDTLTHFNISNPKEIAENLSTLYLSRSPQKTNLFPNTHKALSYLKQKYTLHIITNGFTEVQFVKLRNSNLTTYFDLILCTEEVGVNKPNPLVFETALKRTNANASESLMIGDNLEADIHGAENCGFKTIFFNPHKSPAPSPISLTNSIEIQDLKELIQIL